MCKEVSDGVVIHGTWDTEGGCSQFILCSHPNGLDNVVILLSGCDYGGGVTKVINIPRNKADGLQKLIEKWAPSYGYGWEDAVRELTDDG